MLFIVESCYFREEGTAGRVLWIALSLLFTCKANLFSYLCLSEAASLNIYINFILFHFNYIYIYFSSPEW